MRNPVLFPNLSPQPMDYFEKMYYGRGYRCIAGVDEAGRGCLAGPVVAAAVVLPRNGIEERLYDSKKIPPKKRKDLCEVILTKALGVGVGVISQQDVDLLNILQATLKAMSAALKNLPVFPDFVLVDGLQGPVLLVPQKLIPKGDQLSVSIAAASIVAKVTRDRLMLEYHQKYPQYDFAKHKGYGTEDHLKAIEKFGICDLHRKTFRKVKEHVNRDFRLGVRG